MNTSAVLTPEWVTQPRRALDLSHRLTNKLWWHPVVLLDSPAPHALSWMTLNPNGPLMALFVKATVAQFPRITSLGMYSRVKIEADLESDPMETECFRGLFKCFSSWRTQAASCAQKQVCKSYHKENNPHFNFLIPATLSWAFLARLVLFFR